MGREFYQIEEGWLREQYLDNGLSISKIAKIVGCDISVIHSRMVKFGIPRRNAWVPRDTLYTNEIWLRERFIDDSLMIGEISELAQCHRNTVSKWLREYGIIENERYRWKKSLKNIVICKQCGQEFASSPSRNRSFCSRKCSGLHRRNRIEIECEQCGKHVVIRKKEIDNGYGRFCSQDCYYEWETGENSPAWRGGTSFEPYGTDFNKEFKKKVRERDLYRCAVCEKRALSVHHIDYDKQHTTPENCITLCRSCHSRTNFNRRFWQVVLSPIARRRIANTEG